MGPLKKQVSRLSLTFVHAAAGAAVLIMPSAAWSVGSGSGQLKYPAPGSTLRTNSQACISKFKQVYDMSALYMNGLPAISSVQRLDILLGGIGSTSGFTEITDGTFDTTLYSAVSTYADPTSGAFEGRQLISMDWSDPTKVVLQNDIALKPTTTQVIRTGANYTSCSANEKTDGYIFWISEGSWDWTDPNPMCYGSFTVQRSAQSSNTGICASSKTLSAYVQDSIDAMSAFPDLKDSNNVVIMYGDAATNSAHADNDSTVATARSAALANSAVSIPYPSGMWSYGGGSNFYGYCYAKWSNITYPTDWSDNSQMKQYMIDQYKVQRSGHDAQGAFLASVKATFNTGHSPIEAGGLCESIQVGN